MSGATAPVSKKMTDKPVDPAFRDEQKRLVKLNQEVDKLVDKVGDRMEAVTARVSDISSRIDRLGESGDLVGRLVQPN